MNDEIKIEKPKNRNVFRLEDTEKQLWELSENGLKKGEYLGFPDLHNFYSAKRGSTSYIVAPPAVGKSAIMWEIMMNLAEYSDWKFALFSPETGNSISIFAELLWCHLKKPFQKNNIMNASWEEKKASMSFIHKHFYVLDSGTSDMSLEMCYQAVLDLEEEEGFKIDGVLLDPWTDIVYNTMGQRDDIALGNALTRVRKFSMQYDVHTFIAFHTKQMQLVEKKNANGIPVRFSPPPTMFDVAGGQMAGRKGMFIIGLWRTPKGMEDENGIPYEENEMILEVLKAKPKAVGREGKVRLYYDKWSTRFHMKDHLGNKIPSSAIPDHLKDDKENVSKFKQENIKFKENV